MRTTIITTDVRSQQDVVLARQRARQLGELLGLGTQEQTRLATAVSEIARNAFEHGGGGRVEFALEDDDQIGQLVVARVRDAGPGIPHLADVLAGRYRSEAGLGLGVVGARRLVDRFDIAAPAGAGTTVTLGAAVSRPVGRERVAAIAAELARGPAGSPLVEAQQQNRELLTALAELQTRRAEVERLERELAETNRGVLALYAELDEKAEQLRLASEHKSRFLSSVSHELRTPLASILNISWLLLNRVDGELTAEQERQVGFVRTSAQTLVEIVNDLLDLAKIEAGKIDVRPTTFEAAELLGALRGTFRPLVTNPDVALVVEEPHGIPTLHTDEGKLSQILRNFVSNAVKFTERGEVRVRATSSEDGTVTFAVRDTGIGIAPADQQRIFEEFAQVEGPLQRRVKGTGLGLPLARRLAELLGGGVTLVSEPGCGSEFAVTVPCTYPGAVSGAAPGAAPAREEAARG